MLLLLYSIFVCLYLPKNIYPKWCYLPPLWQFIFQMFHTQRGKWQAVCLNTLQENPLALETREGRFPLAVTVPLHVHMLSALRFATYKIFCSFVVQQHFTTVMRVCISLTFDPAVWRGAVTRIKGGTNWRVVHVWAGRTEGLCMCEQGELRGCACVSPEASVPWFMSAHRNTDRDVKV